MDADVDSLERALRPTFAGHCRILATPFDYEAATPRSPDTGRGGRLAVGGDRGHRERTKSDVKVDQSQHEEVSMAQTSTYLNFARGTEEAFTFYKSVFGTEFLGDIMRHGDVPLPEGAPELSDEDKQLVMNVALPILGGHLLMGTDIPESMGVTVNQGNNVYICLLPDTRSESDTLFAALSAGGKVEQPMQEMFWGDYYGSLVDKFGVQWMINCSSKT
jgi:PhnB protein